MGFRFRKSFGLGGGSRLNFGSRSAGLSFGGRGARFGVSTRGIRSTLSIPGSGLSWTSSRSWGGRRRRAKPGLVSTALGWLFVAWLGWLALRWLVGLVGLWWPWVLAGVVLCAGVLVWQRRRQAAVQGSTPELGSHSSDPVEAWVSMPIPVPTSPTDGGVVSELSRQPEPATDAPDDGALAEYYPLYARAKAFEKLGQPDKALPLYLSILTAYRPVGTAYYERPAILLERTGRLREALAVCDAALTNEGFNASTRAAVEVSFGLRRIRLERKLLAQQGQARA